MKNKFFLMFFLVLTLHSAPCTLHSLYAGELFKNPAAGKSEKWVYRTQEETGKWLIMTETSNYRKEKGKTALVIKSVPENKKFVTTMILDSITLKPILIKIEDDTKTFFEAKYLANMGVINLSSPVKTIKNKKLYVTDITYDQRTLFWLLRGYPFDKPKEMEIDLIMPLGNRCSMKVRCLGEEDIVVPAGKFRAYKLEVEPDAVLPFFSEKLKIHFWYSKDKVPKFLKYYYPAKKLSTELIKYN